MGIQAHSGNSVWNGFPLISGSVPLSNDVHAVKRHSPHTGRRVLWAAAARGSPAGENAGWLENACSPSEMGKGGVGDEGTGRYRPTHQAAMSNPREAKLGCVGTREHQIFGKRWGAPYWPGTPRENMGIPRILVIERVVLPAGSKCVSCP